MQLRKNPTKQELFDFVVDKVVKQGKLCKKPGSKRCSYRYGDLKCAVGHVIADEHYNEGLEGYSISNSSVSHAIKKSIGKYDPCLLDSLQGCHDTSSRKHFLKEFTESARILAKAERLKWKF